MTLEEATDQNLSILSSVCESEQAKAVLAFAKQYGLLTGRITCPDGSCHCAAEYAVHIHSNTYSVVAEVQNDEYIHESIQIVSVLLALEESRRSMWTPGAELLYDIRKAGIKLKREIVTAFLAQLCTTPKDIEARWKMLRKNVLSTAIYCGRLVSLYGTMVGTYSPHGRQSTPEDIMKSFQWDDKEAESRIMNAISTYGTAYLGAANESSVKTLQGLFVKRGYFNIVVSHTGSEKESWTIAKMLSALIRRHLAIEKPQTKEDVGRIVLVDVLCHVSACEVLPYGEGRSSLHMTLGYLDDLLPKDAAAAIAMGGEDSTENPLLPVVMMEYPLVLTLRIADIMATMLDAPA